MYLSHPVRRIRDDPVEGESVTLLVTAEDESDEVRDDLATAVESVGGTVEDRLQFGTLKLSIDQERVADLCALDGIESVETANTLRLDPDGAGEDVEFEE